MIELAGLLGLTVFLLDLWAVASVVGSETAVPWKLLWVLLVVLLPLLGFIMWLIAGPRANWSR